MKKYRFYNFTYSHPSKTKLDEALEYLVAGVREILETEKDEPIKAYNEFRKSHSHFDFMIDEDSGLFVAIDFRLYSATFDQIKEMYVAKNPGHLFLIEESAFKTALQLK